MLGPTQIRIRRSWWLIFSVVLRVHLMPLIGSPAVSSFISFSISAITLGVFFRGLASPAGTPNGFGLQLALEQLPPSLGDGMNVQAGHFRNPSISTPPEQHRFQPREEPALAFIQQAEQQYQGRLALVQREVSALLLWRGWARLTG